MREFIFNVKNIVEYLKQLPLFGMDQGLPNDKIIELVHFSLPHEWKNQIPVQGVSRRALRVLLVLNIAKEIFHNKGNGSHPNKNPHSPMQATKQPRWLREKGQTIHLNSCKRCKY